MKKKKTTNNKSNRKTSQNLGGLFIQKRIDSKGRKYFIDREGKRRKEIDYAAQWSKTGRVSKDSWNKTVKAIDQFEIDDIQEARLVADDFETLRRAKPLRKKEIELLEGGETGIQLFFRATDTVSDAIKGGSIIKILKPNGSNFRKYNEVDAMEIAHKFIDSVSSALEEITKETSQQMTSPLIYFRFQHDIKNNTFFIDFKNLIGVEEFTLMQELIRDNFASYE